MTCNETWNCTTNKTFVDIGTIKKRAQKFGIHSI